MMDKSPFRQLADDIVEVAEHQIATKPLSAKGTLALSMKFVEEFISIALSGAEKNDLQNVAFTLSQCVVYSLVALAMIQQIIDEAMQEKQKEQQP